MPLRGEKHSGLVRDEAPYFESLTELDAWFAQPHNKLSGVLPYRPRPRINGQSSSRAKLLVCHDYKGGYKEYPSGLCYTFNFWPLCDTFVYFSHYRVAVPPSGWTNSAHKQGTRMLGTLIYEHVESDRDCLQLLVGRAGYVVKDNKIPISGRYARLLAELANQRGFDGYLLNFEYRLLHNTDQARALGSWISLLEAELQAKVGSHAQVIWYDSIIYNGSRNWQNRLNGYNLPFFLASGTLFTNYWWGPFTQHLMLQYFERLQQQDAGSPSPKKTLQSIYTGIDVFVRPSGGGYGGGGFCSYRAITHTAPLGFSTALFAPGWTWESATQNPEQNWSVWWENERKLWFGPLRPGETIPVPPSPEGLFKPISAFFQPQPLPNPFDFVFYTNFSPGVGYSWFVEGKKVLDTTAGWTDVDKQTSVGNLVWPWPAPTWQGIEEGSVLLSASTMLDMTDGYNGGNTLKLSLEHVGRKADNTAHDIWLPVQSLTVTALESFEACVVCKADIGTFVLDAKSLSNEEGFAVSEATISQLPHGWTQQTINFMSTFPGDTTSVAIGFTLASKLPEPAVSLTYTVSLGQLSVYPTPPPTSASIGVPSVIEAKFVPAGLPAIDAIEGVLTWDTASTLAPIGEVWVDNPESVTPAWLVQDAPAYRFPTFAYFNVYAAPNPGGSADIDPVFIGTTGLDGRGNRFYVEQTCFPNDWDRQAPVRFFVQGVTDRGEVLPWDRCAIVDYGTITN